MREVQYDKGREGGGAIYFEREQAGSLQRPSKMNMPIRKHDWLSKCHLTAKRRLLNHFFVLGSNYLQYPSFILFSDLLAILDNAIGRKSNIAVVVISIPIQ